MPRELLLIPVFLPLLACSGGVTKGCDSGEVCDTALPAGCDRPAVLVGTGDVAFEAIDEGSPLTMVHGPQGGWHMLASARMESLLPIVTIEFTIDRVSDGARVSYGEYRVQMLTEGECDGYYPGMYGYLDVSEIAEGERDTPPELLGGDDLLIAMEVTDTAGNFARDTLGVVAALDPVDEPDAAR